ncbi:MAG: FliM/FliN family flagellar motor switch protein [Rhodospirillaceae bacterium]|nr:FliM/FliN family flagellar motor switch protein [Rhodospirillaceae bacterium]
MAKDDDDDEEKETRDAVQNVDVEISVVLGQSNLRVNQLLKLGRGAVVELEQRTSDPVEIYANDVLIARGEVVVTSGDKIGVTLTELVKSMYSKMAGK